MNTAYGFHSELLHKYGPVIARTIEDALARLYTSIPLCTWIPHFKTFISHGGPPLLPDKRESASPMELTKINRRLHISTTLRKQIKSSRAPPPVIAMTVLENMLWSDPDPHGSGVRVCVTRGAGLTYGLDALDKWMAVSNLQHYIRSHECVQFGYQMYRCQKLEAIADRSMCTVFSSANYRGAGNDGAVLVISREGVKPVQFHVDDMERGTAVKADYHCYDQYSKDVVIAIFRSLDANGSGELTKEEVRHGLGLAKSFAVHHDLDHCVVGERDNMSKEDFDTLFASMDVDHSGTVGLEEFVASFMKLK
jgi:hypothetical protein